MVFDIGDWQGRFIFTPSYYVKVVSILKDNEIINKSFEGIVVVNENGETSDIPDWAKHHLFEHHKQEINLGAEIFSQQMIIVVSTYIESLVQEFCEVLFIRHPKRMYSYLVLSDDKNEKTTIKGQVSLKMIVAKTSKEELIRELAKQAAKELISKSWKKAFDEINNISGKRKISTSIKKEILKILELRNKIIHENASFDIDEGIVNKAFTDAGVLLEELANILKDNNVPYSDPGYLIDSMPEIPNSYLL